MTRRTAIATDIRVSLQHRTAPDRAAGHIAAAVLLDEDLVIAPMPRPELLDREWDPEVLIFAYPPRADMPIEAITAGKLLTFSLDDRPEAPTCLVIKLDRHSGYRPPFTELRGAEVIRRLDQLDGDLWAAATAAELVDQRVREISRDTLDEVTRLEREQLRPVRIDYVFPSHAHLIKGVCQIPVCVTVDR